MERSNKFKVNRKQLLAKFKSLEDLQETIESDFKGDELLSIMCYQVCARMRHTLANEQQRQLFTAEEFGLDEFARYLRDSVLPKRRRRQTQFYGF